MQNKALLFTAALVGLPSTCIATNTDFLPGDAFFHTHLDADALKRIANSKAPAFGYVRPGNPGEPYLCGYVGFWILKFPNMPTGLRKNVAKAHALVVKARAAKRGAQKPISMFFYNAEFDFHKHALCLRYNEKWSSLTDRFEPFVNLPEAIIREWRDATKVKPLAVKSPSQERKPAARPSEKPILAGKELRIILLVDTNHTHYFKKTKGKSFFEVTEQAIRRFTSDGRKWKRVPVVQ